MWCFFNTAFSLFLLMGSVQMQPWSKKQIDKKIYALSVEVGTKAYDHLAPSIRQSDEQLIGLGFTDDMVNRIKGLQETEEVIIDLKEKISEGQGKLLNQLDREKAAVEMVKCFIGAGLAENEAVFFHEIMPQKIRVVLEDLKRLMAKAKKSPESICKTEGLAILAATRKRIDRYPKLFKNVIDIADKALTELQTDKRAVLSSHKETIGIVDSYEGILDAKEQIAESLSNPQGTGTPTDTMVWHKCNMVEFLLGAARLNSSSYKKGISPATRSLVEKLIKLIDTEKISVTEICFRSGIPELPKPRMPSFLETNFKVAASRAHDAY